MNPIPRREHDQDIDNAADAFGQACTRLGAILGLVHEGLMVGGLTGARLDLLSALIDEWREDLPALQYWLTAEGYLVPPEPYPADPRAAMLHFLTWQEALIKIGVHARPQLVRAVEDYVRSVPGFVH